MRLMREHREYGQHRSEDSPTHVDILTGARFKVDKVRVPTHPSILRQRANLNAIAYDRGQGREV